MSAAKATKLRFFLSSIRLFLRSQRGKNADSFRATFYLAAHLLPCPEARLKRCVSFLRGKKQAISERIVVEPAHSIQVPYKLFTLTGC